eukprot:gene12236-15377_t
MVSDLIINWLLRQKEALQVLVKSLFRDLVHLRREQLGPLWVSDLIINWLLRQEETLQAMPPAEVSTLNYTMPAARFLKKWTQQRCYGLNLRDTNTDAELSKVTGVDWKAHLKGAGETFNFGALGETDRQRFTALPTLKVVSLTGWGVQMFYKNSKGEGKMKPGFVTKTPGAVLEVEVDSLFPELQGGGPGYGTAPQVEAMIKYTRSYDGWGKVQVTCTSGCTCSPTDIDASSTEQTSLLTLAPVAVTQHRQCRLKLTVLNETSSDGHRFKLSSVSVQYQEELKD